MSHERQVEFVTADVLESGELGLEELGNAVWGRTTILRAQVEAASVPLAVDVDDVVILGILWRWFDELGLQERLDKLIGLVLDFRFD